MSYKKKPCGTYRPLLGKSFLNKNEKCAENIDAIQLFLLLNEHCDIVQLLRVVAKRENRDGCSTSYDRQWVDDDFIISGKPEL